MPMRVPIRTRLIRQLEIKHLSLHGQSLQAREITKDKKHFGSFHTMNTYMSAVGATKRTALEAT
jgi:hypothetical protein